MNEHKNIITIEDEIKEFSDKPVKSSALYKKAKELESNAVPDASEASVGDVLSLDEDKKPTWATPSGGGGGLIDLGQYSVDSVTVDGHTFTPNTDALYAISENNDAAPLDKNIIVVEDNANIDFSKNIYYMIEDDYMDLITSVGFIAYDTPTLAPSYNAGFYVEGTVDDIFNGGSLIVKKSDIKYGNVVPTIH